MLYFAAAFAAICSYLLGSINTSVILSKSIYGSDIRHSGSGNAGATNMLRTYGKGIAAATLVCDVAKGILAVAIGMWIDIFLTSDANNIVMTAAEQKYILNNIKYIAGIFVVLGHDFPIFFNFRGGKGVATSLGVMMILNWKVGLIVLAAAIIIMAVSRYVSLGSISAAAMYPFILFTYITASGEPLERQLPYLTMAFLLALILILKHHSNIAKLKNGTENKLFSRKTEIAENDAESNEEENSL